MSFAGAVDQKIIFTFQLIKNKFKLRESFSFVSSIKYFIFHRTLKAIRLTTHVVLQYTCLVGV